MTDNRDVLVFGATGNVGGAATRELLRRGWRVRAVTRDPQSEEARALVELGAEPVRADMDDRASLEAVFDGTTRVTSVQNWVTAGVEGEMRQGKLVAEVAKEAQVRHMVYISAGIGRPGTGVAHFDNKMIIEAYLRDLGLPVTVIRPCLFMELMIDKAFYPQLATWGTMPRIVGWNRPIPWVAVHDIGVAIANAFEEPETWIGRDIILIGDMRSLGRCREAFQAVTGKKPFRVPLPAKLFSKMAGEEMLDMWSWLADWSAAGGADHQDLSVSREVCPNPLTVESWLRQVHTGANGR